MSYTPPAGNAVTFDFTGAAAYTAPGGAEVILSFEPTGPIADVASVVPFTGAAIGTHGVSGVAVTQLTVSVYVIGIEVGVGTVVTDVPFAIHVDCSTYLDNRATAHALVPVTAHATGVSAVYAECSTHVPMHAIVLASTPANGATAMAVSITAGVIGAAPPHGRASARIRIVGDVTSNVGRTATTRVRTPLNVSVLGAAGRFGGISAELRLRGSAQSSHGVSASSSSATPIACSAAGAHRVPYASVVSTYLPINALCVGYSPHPGLVPSLHIVTRQRRTEVWTE